MKKVLGLIFILLSAGLLTAGYLVYDRYSKNPEQVFPYPYEFKAQATPIKLDAPILITGDRMGAYFAKFNSELASAISVNLAKPIKIQSLAKNGYALHRTLHELRSLVQWPQIVIYQGASEEFSELKFVPENAAVIQRNFAMYSDDRVETALILYPWLSRLIYEPHSRIKLEEAPTLLMEVTEADYVARLETELLLFEQQLIQLVNLSKDRNTLLILTTTPLNLDIAPKKVCEFASTIDIEKDLVDINEQLNANNPKAAYKSSSKLVQQYAGNAQLFFTHGQILNRLGRTDEAKNALLQSTAYDCDPWRSTAVYNSIIRKVARNHQVILFDFAKLLENQWNKNTTFFDELYPQNLYYDKGMKQLGLVIKQILKL
jgi:hypothetical protein